MIREILKLIIHEATSRNPDNIKDGLGEVQHDITRWISATIQFLDYLQHADVKEETKEEIQQLILTVPED